tara:strand:+ start:617 stop:838 length:222 start_codon:yes stop_codon:yes gene_type:complete
MNKEFERYLVIFLLLVLIGLSGCAKKPTPATKPDSQPEVYTDSVGKMEGIANALGCMFAPETCKSTKQEKEDR